MCNLRFILLAELILYAFEDHINPIRTEGITYNLVHKNQVLVLVNEVMCESLEVWKLIGGKHEPLALGFKELRLNMDTEYLT